MHIIERKFFPLFPLTIIGLCIISLGSSVHKSTSIVESNYLPIVMAGIEHDSNWIYLGSNETGINGGSDIKCSFIYDGAIYFAGDFNHVNGKLARIARWDGNEWQGLFPDIYGLIESIVIINDTFYVGGSVSAAGGNVMNGLAMYDGISWYDMHGGLTAGGNINDMEAFQGDLYVAGVFNEIGDSTYQGVARWSNGTWYDVDTLSNYNGYSLLSVLDTVLYIGGQISTFQRFRIFNGDTLISYNNLSATPIDMVAADSSVYFATSGGIYQYYDGLLTKKGGPATFDAFCIGSLNDTIYAGGRDEFYFLDGNTLIDILPTGMLVNSRFYTIDTFNSNILSAGNYGLFCEDDNPKGPVIQFDGKNWNTTNNLPIEVPDGGVNSIVRYQNEWVVCGSFRTIGDSCFYGIASWNGTRWKGLNSENSSGIAFTSLAAKGDTLILGGEFSSIDFTPANNIALYDGSSWHAMGSGTNERVQALKFEGDTLYVGGEFTSAGGSTNNRRITSWSNGIWQSMGTGLFNGSVFDILCHNDTIYIGGTFFNIGNTNGDKIAFWDGNSWKSFPTNPGFGSKPVHALGIWDGTLYAGGGLSSTPLKKFSNGLWSAATNDLSGTVFNINPVDSGLFIGGLISRAGTSAEGIFRWNGKSWSDLGSGFPSGEGPGVVILHDDTMAMGGTFTKVGDSISTNLVFWELMDKDEDGYFDFEDCLDTDNQTFPGAPEICDSIDNDCNGLVDDGLINRWFADADNDGFGNIHMDSTTCSPPIGYVQDSTDCNDTDSLINPSAPELCDGIDSNCDGYTEVDSDGDNLLDCEDPCSTTGYDYLMTQWVYGGSNSDFDVMSISNNNGGYYVCGISYSPVSGDKTEESTGGNLWILEIDSNGVILWQNTLQTLGNSQEPYISLTLDGSLIVTASTDSDAFGDKSENSLGGIDGWIVKLDANGTIIWENTIGGNYVDILTDVAPTSDSAFILAFSSYSSISGDKTTPNISAFDYWMVKIDKGGNVVWDKNYGGTGDDFVTSVEVDASGNIYAGGYSNSSISGDKTEDSRGDQDFWLIKLDENGNLLWDKTIGGDRYDQLFSITQTPDSCLILGGISISEVSFEKSEPSLGLDDYWVVKIDQNGNRIWDRTIGGSSFDFCVTTGFANDGGVILAGGSASPVSGHKSEPKIGAGFYDYWIVKLDKKGVFLWDKTIGGSESDLCTNFLKNPDGSFLLSGYSSSDISGNKIIPSRGNFDLWLVKIPDREQTYFADYDGDGFGTGNPIDTSCLLPQGYSQNNLDCNDNDSTINPHAMEFCDFVDNNCNGIIDEGFINHWFADFDGDGFGDKNIDSLTCFQPLNYVADSTDCNDMDSMINPSVSEICDSVDNECNGVVDDVVFIGTPDTLPKSIPTSYTSFTSVNEVQIPIEAITDVNIIDLDIDHSWVGDLTITLKSPENTTVTLFQQSCFDAAKIKLSYDDESPNSVLPCPPSDETSYQPVGNLSDFYGENPNGTWTLEITDVFQGEGGSLNHWSLDFGSGVCGCTDTLAHNYDSLATIEAGNCETCSDGIQNGDETGIDCGGSLCPPCIQLDIADQLALYSPALGCQDIQVSGYQDIISFSFKVKWNPSIVFFSHYDDLHASLGGTVSNTTQTDSTFEITYSDPGGTTLPDSSKLMELCFILIMEEDVCDSIQFDRISSDLSFLNIDQDTVTVYEYSGFACVFDPCTSVYTCMDDDPGSLSYSIDCAQPGDTVSFAQFIINDTIPGQMGEVVIDKDLTIIVDPAQNVFLSGQFNMSAIHILPGVKVTIIGLNLLASETDPGTAINNEGELILKDVKVCPPPGSEAGVLIQNSGELEILGDSDIKGKGDN